MRRFPFLLLLALALLCTGLPPATPAGAASCTWTGAISTAWETADNWSCGTVPTAADSVTINSVGATIALNSAAQAASLTITRGSLTGAGSLNVSGLTQIQSIQSVTISTNGSRFPQLEIDTTNGTVQITDPALTADSLQSLTFNASASSFGTTFEIGDHTIGTLTMTRGSLSWGSTFTITEALNWPAGSFSNTFGQTATLVLADTATGAIPTATGGQYLFGARLINNGILTVSGIPALTLTSGNRRGQLINNSLLEFLEPGNISIGNSGDVINNGTLRKAGTGMLQFNTGVTLINNGLLDIGSATVKTTDFAQYGGEVRLAGGALQGGTSQFAQIRLDGGTISGSGTLTGTVQNIGGTLAPNGRLTMIGGYIQSPTATLALTISGLLPVSDFGILEIKPNQGIGGGASINGGRLQINAGNGFSPISGDRFQIATCTTSCNGSFGTIGGSLSPAFSGFPNNQEIVIAEAQETLLIGVRPERARMQRNEENGYTVTFRNPTTATIQVNSLLLTLPISFTYKAGSTSGATTTDPFDIPVSANGTRQLSWTTPISVPAGTSAELRFRIAALPAIDIGTHTIDLNVQAGAKSIAYQRIAPITIPLSAIQSLTIQSGGVIQQSASTQSVLMLPRTALNDGISVRVRIVCPFASCGNLTNVYIEHGGQLLNMSPATAPTNSPTEADDYGFWDGYISGPSVFPGEPIRIFPDWDDHRPCIYYDYGGGGGRPQGCVPGGDDLPLPKLYDPSGIISDAETGQPVTGATVTLFRIPNAMPDTRTQTRECRTIDTRGGNVWSGTAPNTGLAEDPGLLPIQIDPQVNPQVTGSDGRYGWNVVTGCWYVEVRAPGYITQISALVGVPPEVTDLDIALQRDGTSGGDQYIVYLPQIRR